ncbi:MAG: hypothetical protein KU29_07395 [Sulfurovum sp. FS06-10]|nr:MAG: hypothetical protein KU29_07395 [Sulfurovum sp. FS06-10]
MTSEQLEKIYMQHFMTFKDVKIAMLMFDFVFSWHKEHDYNVAILLTSEMDEKAKLYLQHIIDYIMNDTFNSEDVVWSIVRHWLFLTKLAELMDDEEIDKLDYENILKNDPENVKLEYILITLFVEKISNYLDFVLNEPQLFTNDSLQNTLDNSFDQAIDKIKKDLESFILPLKAYTPIEVKQIIDEISQNKSILQDMFSNSKKFAKIKLGNHFLSELMNNKVVHASNGKLCFAEFTKAIVEGYTAKAIMLGIDTRKALKELSKDKEIFEKHNDTEKIKFINAMVEFLEANKNAKYIPFKIIGSTMGMSKNEARNFAKRVFNLNENSFNEDFDRKAPFPFAYFQNNKQ